MFKSCRTAGPLEGGVNGVCLACPNNTRGKFYLEANSDLLLFDATAVNHCTPCNLEHGAGGVIEPISQRSLPNGDSKLDTLEPSELLVERSLGISYRRRTGSMILREHKTLRCRTW